VLLAFGVVNSVGHGRHDLVSASGRPSRPGTRPGGTRLLPGCDAVVSVAPDRLPLSLRESGAGI